MNDATKRIAWGTAGLILLLIGLTVAGPRVPNEVRLRSTVSALEAAGAGPVLEDGLACIEPVRLKRGGTLAGALMDAGVAPGSAASVVASLKPVLNVRLLRPEDRMTLHRTRSGDVQTFTFQRRLEERVVVERTPDGFYAERVREPVEMAVRKLVGNVESNLSVSITAAGGGASLVPRFADLFSWDFDFTTDTRPGDRFSLLVEEKHLHGERIGYGRILSAEYLPVGDDTPLEVFHFAWNGGAEEGYYDAKGRSIRKFFLKSPLNFSRVSSHFSHKRMHPILKRYRPHLGVDYAAPSGTPVVALGSGRVALAGRRGGYGKTVQIKHNGTYLSQYAHLSRYAKGIRTGTRVKQGQVIGYVGSTGLSTGPHLDFRVQKNGSWVNPLRLDGGQSEPLPKGQQNAFLAAVARVRELNAGLPDGGAIPVPEDAPADPALAWVRLDTPSPS